VEFTLQQQKFPKLSQFLCRKMAKFRQGKKKKHCLQHERGFFYSHIFKSRQIWLNIFMDNHHVEQHNKIEKKKTLS
jgi:hypothetical protein